jgi:hypothetical protein
MDLNPDFIGTKALSDPLISILLLISPLAPFDATSMKIPLHGGLSNTTFEEQNHGRGYEKPLGIQ